MLTFSAAVDAALAERTWSIGLFFELYALEATFRYWNGNGEINPVDINQTFEGIGPRMRLSGDLEIGIGLESRTISLEFDSARQVDNDDPLGQIYDSTWQGRRCRLAEVMFVPHQNRTVPIGVTWQQWGNVDRLVDTLSADSEPTTVMSIETGTFRYLERNLLYRSEATQKRLFPGDTGMDLQAQMVGVELPWRSKWSTAAGGGSNGGGGGQRDPFYDVFNRFLR